MTDLALTDAKTSRREITAWDRLKVNRDWLALWFMLRAAAFLILFLAYPLGLGVWISFTDARIGRSGAFVGLENYEWLWGDTVFWLSVFNTRSTRSLPAFKFAVGFYLALLLSEFAVQGDTARGGALILSSCRPVVGTVFLAVRQPVFNHLVVDAVVGLIATISIFSAIHGTHAGRSSSQILARRAVRRHNAACRAADGVAVALRGRHHRRCQPMADIPLHHYPLLTLIIAVVMTFSVLSLLTSLIWVLTRGGRNATQLWRRYRISAPFSADISAKGLQSRLR
jgi:multiple sugar transport system permease protein